MENELIGSGIQIWKTQIQKCRPDPVRSPQRIVNKQSATNLCGFRAGA